MRVAETPETASEPQEVEGNVANESGGEEAQPDASPQADDDGLALVVIDPCEEDRLAVAALENEVGRPISAMDPSAICADLFEDFAEARVILVEWDLGGRLGLDLVEHFIADPRIQDVPILLASAVLTRSMVLNGFRSGARGFVSKPYSAEEIRARLAQVPLKPKA